MAWFTGTLTKLGRVLLVLLLLGHDVRNYQSDTNVEAKQLWIFVFLSTTDLAGITKCLEIM